MHQVVNDAIDEKLGTQLTAMTEEVDDKIAQALENFDGGQGDVNIEENEAFLELQDSVEELR